MRAITVCVDMADLLAVTLPYNRHHFDEVLVVTSHNDTKTQHIAAENRAQVFLTDAFHRHSEDFNKWAALEEGLDSMGRHGWLCIMDPDILWPKEVSFSTHRNGETKPQFGNLYSPLRRMWTEWPRVPAWYEMRERIDPSPLPENHWHLFPLHPQQREFAGYTQIFHADDPHLPKPPWHQTDWRHAGGADSWFQALWPTECKVRPPFEVLHLGPAGVNWCGRSPEQQAKLQDYLRGRIGKSGNTRHNHERLPPL